jgi:hypothetical protein
MPQSCCRLFSKPRLGDHCPPLHKRSPAGVCPVDTYQCAMGGHLLPLAPRAGFAGESIQTLRGRDGRKQTCIEGRAEIHQAHCGRHGVHGIQQRGTSGEIDRVSPSTHRVLQKMQAQRSDWSAPQEGGTALSAPFPRVIDLFKSPAHNLCV